MKDSDKARFDALLAWSQQHGAELHPSLEIYHDDVTKFSLRVKGSAKEGLEPGFMAVSCPVSTTLSFLNALVDGPIILGPFADERTPAFPRRFMASAPPHVISRFFLIKEYLKGKASFWWPYIAALPQPEHVSAWALPAFWPEDDIAYLDGTNVFVAIEEIQDHVRREFKEARKVLKEESFPSWRDYTQMLYKWAYCIFTSRSFRPSLILSGLAKDRISSLLPAGCELDDFSILQPLFDIANHSMSSRYTWDATSDPSSCQLICRDAYQPGDQVFNNYGLKTNTELLLAYGFILPETETLHNDYVHVRKRQQQGESSSDQKPKDFLISLRPINHSSSLAARARCVSGASGSTGRLSAVPGLAHFEPALVEDMSSVLATPEEKQALQQWQACQTEERAGEQQQQQQQQQSPPAALTELIARVKCALAGKLQYDYQRLMEAEGEHGLPEPANRNQMLAVEYRRQCERVLTAALEELMVGEEGEEEVDG
ncbi:hypothetical protein VTK26DRAFT_5583 [Humicola hyalothermophila]